MVSQGETSLDIGKISARKFP